MANVIKHKRGSGSDPVASDLVVGEVAIRTDVGKLFTKMDNGSVAEIAGGGSDIAINTLSSSSGTGGGSATFNGSAYRFTLSAPPSVSAQQLLVSINGVIQKPVPGTGQPSEGFSVDGTDIILGDAPEAGSDFFIITFKSLGVSEPADNSVTSAKIVDGTIVNADINASATIAVSKLATFVNNNADNRVITGSGTANTLNGESNLTVGAQGDLHIKDPGNTSYTNFTGSTDAGIIIGNGLLDSAGVQIRTNTSGSCKVNFGDGDGSSSDRSKGFIHYTHSNDSMQIGTNSLERMFIDSSGNVGIGTISPTSTGIQSGIKTVQIDSGDGAELILGNSQSSNVSTNHIGAIAFKNIDASTGAAPHYAGIRCNATDSSGGMNLKFYAGSTKFETDSPHMLIDSSGRLLIGTTSTTSQFQIGAFSGYTWDVGDTPQILIAGLNNESPTSGTLNIALRVADENNNNMFQIHNRGGGNTDVGEVYIAGKVGIGTSNPTGGKLHIAHGNEFGLYTSGPFNFQAKFESTDAEAAIVIEDVNSTTDYNRIGVIGNEMQFVVNNGAAVHIDSSRRLLAGSTSTANNGRIQGFIDHGSTAGESGITSVDSNDAAAGVGGEISFYGKTNNAGEYNYLGHVRGIKENGTNADTACALTFHTRPTLTAPQERMRISSTGDVTVSTGNLVIGTAGRGIDFSATSHATGKTSELFDDYEEGTWTPTPTAGSFTSATGRYTKVGRIVVATFAVQVNTDQGASFFQLNGLPFDNVASNAGENLSSFGFTDSGLNGNIVGTLYTGTAMIFANFSGTNYRYNTSGVSGKIFRGGVTYMSSV